MKFNEFFFVVGLIKVCYCVGCGVGFGKGKIGGCGVKG